MSDSVVLAILEAVATARDVDPIELPPLADHLDPDALHQLIESANTDLHVKMSIYGCRIEIDQHGTVKAEREFHE